MKLLPFSDYDLKTAKILEALNEASRSLAELKGFANSIPNQHILINAITINEAKDSSAIENIVTTHDSIYKVLTESGYKEDAAKEVVDYRSAIWRGYEIIKEKEFISTNILVELQAMIEPNKTGIRKTPGTNLVNSSTGEIIYTPPQAENEIRDLLKNLEDYINDTNDETDPLIKMALIHYQFEGIHPFYDGNGRTGRILNVLYLVLNHLLDSPILYLSNYINRNKSDYYRLLSEFREKDNYEDWIIYILKGIEETSKNTIELIKKILEEMESYKKDFIEKLPKIYSDELLDSLFFEVYTRINYIEDRCGVTRQTAATYLSQLVDAGLLEYEKIGRESIYKNTRLTDLLKKF
ncbi:MAG: addiction module protein [Firmicutes bacterium CAG:321_26_22]|nr:MAG: addiction module protein [Firmicutes bacterium CAG:321_26_22]